MRPLQSCHLLEPQLTLESTQCVQCDSTFSTAGNLKRHMVKHNNKENSFKCKQRHFRFYWESALKRHLKTHNGEKSFKCNQCTYSSFWQSDLNDHLKRHGGKKSEKCHNCDAAFVTVRDLKGHIRQVHKRQPCSAVIEQV